MDFNCDNETNLITITGASDTIICTPVNDSMYDPDETITLTIQAGSYTIGTASDSITISDNETAAAVYGTGKARR